MRIPDETQLYNPGDEVIMPEGLTGVVQSVRSHSVYYEARPIASYLRYTYIVEYNGRQHYLKADQLSPIC